MDFVLLIWFTVVSTFCPSHSNLSVPPQFFPTSGVLSHFEMSSDDTERRGKIQERITPVHTSLAGVEGKVCSIVFHSARIKNFCSFLGTCFVPINFDSGKFERAF